MLSQQIMLLMLDPKILKHSSYHSALLAPVLNASCTKRSEIAKIRVPILKVPRRISTDLPR